MGLFKSRKNKKFNYTARFYTGETNPYQIKHKFDSFRNTIEKTNIKHSILTSISDLRLNNKNNVLLIFIIFSLLFLYFLFIIDFDLTIFLWNE